MTVNDAQVRRLIAELIRHGELGKASMKPGMARETGGKYRDSGRLPSQMQVERNRRTRSFPFEEDWSDIVGMLTGAPELEVRTVFEHLQRKHPERYQDGQLRTLQRAVKRWKAKEGPEKEVFFPQEHRPGEILQTDGTCGNELRTTILGEAFPHLLCHSVLPYSNWEYATVCQSESLLALRACIQGAVFKHTSSPSPH